MKKLITIIALFLSVSSIAQVIPVQVLTIPDANLLPQMMPSSAHFKVGRVYGSNVQAEYYFVNGTPTSPSSAYLASLNLNIISTYIDPVTGHASGYWSTIRDYTSALNTVFFEMMAQTGATHLITLVDIVKQDSVLRKADSLRLVTQTTLRKADSIRINNNSTAITASQSQATSYNSRIVADSVKLNTTNSVVATKLSGTNGQTGLGSVSGTNLTLSPLQATDITPFTNPLYKPIGYVPAWTDITGKPLFATVATSGSYADLTGKPTLFSGSYTDLTNKPTIYTFTGTTGQYTRGDGTYAAFPTIPTNTNQLTNGSGYITAQTTLVGYGITDAYTKTLSDARYLQTETDPTVPTYAKSLTAFSVIKGSADALYYPLTGNPSVFLTANQNITLTGDATGSGNTAIITKVDSTKFETVANLFPRADARYLRFPVYNNVPARALTTAFRPSTTRPTKVSYTVSIATTLSLLNLNSSGTVFLQISPDGTTWTTINKAGITRTLAVSISVGLNDTSLLNVAGEIPANYYCRLLPTISGGATIAFDSGQEVTN